MPVRIRGGVPSHGWRLRVPPWARRAGFLWAGSPPLALSVLERLLFHTGHFAAFLGHFFTGGTEGRYAPGTLPMLPGTHLTPGRFLVTLGLWIGLAVTAAFLALAGRLGPQHGPPRFVRSLPSRG